MRERTSFVLSVLVVLILFAPGSASAGKGSCGACSDVAQERCTTNCFGLGDKAERVDCLIPATMPRPPARVTRTSLCAVRTSSLECHGWSIP
jgi:hypothetical protein